ncbi:MAG: catalase [Bacteroidetes bacterium]|nr:catalase [Bacteroidota bacterium]
MKDKESKLTRQTGAPVGDNQNVQTTGLRGPMLMQDAWFLEKMANFDREVIPERKMHTKGSGAFGTFAVTHHITKYIKARIFSEVGKKTELFSRFSTVAGERGGAEKFIQIRQIRNCFKADPEYGQGVAKALGLTMDEVNNFDMSLYDKWAPKPTNR